MLIKSENSCKCWVFETCLGVKKWVTSKCSKKLKRITSESAVAPISSPMMGLDGVGFGAEWHQRGLLETSLSGSNLSKDIYVFAIRSYGLLGDLKWNHTHGWLYWWFTFTANSLSSAARLSLTSLQRAHILWGDVLITTICVTLLRTLL